MPIDDSVQAFVAHGLVERRGAAAGPLAGLTFALKDSFDVEGVPTGAGNPDWLTSHPIPTKTSPVPQALLDAGAQLVGKTQMDDMAWSLNGENAHYGTPQNVAAPGRIPGGSSSGSAAACAAGLCDFAIGSDTAGSVRLPASYCGLYGFRPTHGRLSLEGVVPLAPSFDVAGWFARDAELLARVGRVLLADWREPARPARLLIADDMFARAEIETRTALAAAVERLSAMFGTVEHINFAGDRAADWREVFRVVQAGEAWAAHGAWVERVRPRFAPGVKERFAAAAQVTAEAFSTAKAARERIRAELEARIPPGTILALPTAPGIAPPRGTLEIELNIFRMRTLELLGPVGHAGMPQVSLPGATVEGCPVGLSLVAARGGDEALLGLAGAWG